MKGVMMLVNYFPPLPTGGAERQAERLATYLISRNVPSSVITRRVGSLPRHERRDGFDVYRLAQFGPGKIKTVTFTIAAIISLLRLRHSYDILHAHLAFSPAIAAAVAGKILRKVVIVKFGSNNTSSGEIKLSQKTWRGRLRLAILRRWVDICIALDSEMEKEILDAGFLPNRVIRMGNGIDTARFKPYADKFSAKKALDLGSGNKILVLYTGRLISEKALDLLLMAMKQAMASCKELHLLMIGKGNERDALVALAEKLGIQHCVTFIDYINDVQPYLNAGDIFVLPSLGEGISNSLLEAMSCGLACISTRVGGSTEVLGDGKYGLIVPPNSVEELTEALVRLGNSASERTRLGNLARQRILEKYDFQVVGEQYYSLYTRLLEVK
jgi:glycosyltransferase involved in cell wall biosynthesis